MPRKENNQNNEQVCRERFDHLPISLWYEDFSQGKRLFNTLREKGVKDLEAYLDANPEALLTFAGLTHVTDVNQTTLELYGASCKKELLGTLDKILVVPEALKTFKKGLISLYEGHVMFEAETVTNTLQGKPLQILIRWTVPPGHEEALDLILVSVLDITALKQAEEKQKLEAKRLSILHEIENAILQNQPVERIVADFLPKIARLLGCSRGSALRFDMEKDVAYFMAFHGEGAYATKKQIPLSFLRDLTPLKQGNPRIVEDLSQETDLTESDRDLLSHGFKAYITFPLIVEESLYGILNFGKVQPGKFLSYHVGIINEVANIFSIVVRQAALQERITRHTQELEAKVAKQTHQLTVKIEEEKRLNAALGNLLEDLQATNRILTQTTQQLEEANEELRIFTTSVSHDLRAPLRAIEGFGQAFLEDYETALDSTAQEYLFRIVNAARSMDTLITDLLTYSQLSAKDVALQPVHLDSAVRQALKTFSSEIENSGARIEVRYPLGWIMGHPTLLKQVLDNLVSNALKFTRQAPPEIRIHAEERDLRIRLYIQDNGIGISPEHHARIFNLFERLHGVETYTGTGVGLTIVQKGVKKMKGRVGITSQEGKGSTFWIDFLKANSTGGFEA